MNLRASENYSKAVVQHLKEIRLKMGISQNLLAKKAGVSRAAIQHIENEIRNPTVVTVHAIATALGVSMTQVVRDVEKR